MNQPQKSRAARGEMHNCVRTTVVVRAHDGVHGYGCVFVKVDLPR